MLHIQRNLDGSLKTNRILHTADIVCDLCGAMASVNMNATANYFQDDSGNNDGILLLCSAIGGSCDTQTVWPLLNGTIDAQELALVKSA